jgi:hypothetical protein
MRVAGVAAIFAPDACPQASTSFAPRARALERYLDTILECALTDTCAINLIILAQMRGRSFYASDAGAFTRLFLGFIYSTHIVAIPLGDAAEILAKERSCADQLQNS